MSSFKWSVPLALAVVGGLGAVTFVSLRAGAESRGPARGERVAIRVGVPVGGRVEKTDAEWRTVLSPQAYRVTRQAGTERAFTGATWDNHAAGEYRCACCEQPLFDSEAKYDSGTGWPSFRQPVRAEAVSLFEDHDPFGARVEVTCSRCDAHLGHVFDDGPPPTGRRFCMNSAALLFAPR